MTTLWSATDPVPTAEDMPDLDVVTHVAVARARPGGWHYLHETALARHADRFHLVWAAHPTCEANEIEESLRGSSSADALAWDEPVSVRTPPEGGGHSWNHPVLWSDAGVLWGFFTRWRARRPETAIMRWEGSWQDTGAVIPGLIPFNPPLRLADGSLAMSGEFGWNEGAVALSRGDPLSWAVVRLPLDPAIPLRFPEVTLWERADALLAIFRPGKPGPMPVCRSVDGGRTWSPPEASDLAAGDSKPLSLRLSTGQQILLSNDPVAGRTLLRIAASGRDGAGLRRMWKLRHQAFPRRRLFGGWGSGPLVGHQTEWSYPSAVEWDGRLFVSYSQGKEDAALSIVPIAALAVE